MLKISKKLLMNIKKYAENIFNYFKSLGIRKVGLKMSISLPSFYKVDNKKTKKKREKRK